jgi:HD-like signal output (HDOD) protein
MRERIRSAVRDSESAEEAYRRRISAMLEQIDLVGLHLVFNLVLSLSQSIHRKEA